MQFVMSQCTVKFKTQWFLQELPEIKQTKIHKETTGYSRTSDNGPSEKWTTFLQRTHSVLRIEITVVVILKQPPRSGRFLIPDSGQDPNSQMHFSIQNSLQIMDTQETPPLKLYHTCCAHTFEDKFNCKPHARA